MFFYEELVIDIIFILFPIFVYFIFICYNRDLPLKKKELLLDFANITMLYLLVRFDYLNKNNIYLMILVNVPLVVSFLYKRKETSIFISILIVFYYYFVYDLNIYFMLLEYLFYNAFFSWLGFNIEKYSYIFMFIKGAVLSVLVFYIFPEDVFYIALIKLFLLLVMFYIVTHLSIKIIRKTDDIMNLSNVLGELEREKELKNSLFKITHEIKNPISVCMGYLSMMDYKDVKKIKKYNAIISEEINRTLLIMDEFNSYSKITVSLVDMDFIMLIDDTLSSLNIMFSKNNIKIINNIKVKSLYINGDYNKLKQVFVNMLKNCVEAISSDGEIVLSLVVRETYVRLIIKDNGAGMTKDTLSKVGEMFYTTKSCGTGLGVKLSKEIIKLHSGYIRYISKEGCGTKTIICIGR